MAKWIELLIGLLQVAARFLRSGEKPPAPAVQQEVEIDLNVPAKQAVAEVKEQHAKQQVVTEQKLATGDRTLLDADW